MNGCQSVPPTPCPWIISHRADQKARRVADRHYTRQKVGTPQFVPPGRCIVLRTPNEDAYWVSSWPFPRYVKHAWAGAWTCSAFRNESPQSYLSSDMIRHAVAITREIWGDPPPLGMVTFVDPKKVRRKRDIGRCFRRAGFRPARCPVHDTKVSDCCACHHETKGGLFALLLSPEDMPPPAAAPGQQLQFFAVK
jgi:hypothetical protein